MMETKSARDRSTDKLYELSKRVVAGIMLEEALEFVFQEFGGIIPFERIGYAEIDRDRERVAARWMRSHHKTYLNSGYSAPLSKSSLRIVIERGVPRVMNDLRGYLQRKPDSESTRLIVKEGIQSSLTCPLLVGRQAVGFLFFSCLEKNAYDDEHVKIATEICRKLGFLLLVAQDRYVASEPIVDEALLQPLEQGDEIALPETRSLYELRPGMVLAQPLQSDDGRLLLGAGCVISAQQLKRIHRLHTQGILHIQSTVVLDGVRLLHERV